MHKLKELRIGLVNGAYTLRDDKGMDVGTLAVGDAFELELSGEWQQVRLESGGYQGVYYLTVDGERGRLALCMKARWCEPQQAHGDERQAEPDPVVLPALEAARLAWVGKLVTSRVALAGGCVRGTVREITTGGQVVFVYLPRCNQVPVQVTFPVEWLLEVLHQPGDETVAA